MIIYMISRIRPEGDGAEDICYFESKRRAETYIEAQLKSTIGKNRIFFIKEVYCAHDGILYQRMLQGAGSIGIISTGPKMGELF